MSDLHQTRRQFFGATGLSLAPWALSALIGDELNAGETAGDAPSLAPHFKPRAKSIIYLFMIGGPSQLDLFDPKEELIRRTGEPMPESYLKPGQFAQIQEKRPNLMGTPWKFSQHGESGATVSELLPHTASIVDQISIVKNAQDRRYQPHVC